MGPVASARRCPERVRKALTNPCAHSCTSPTHVVGLVATVLHLVVFLPDAWSMCKSSSIIRSNFQTLDMLVCRRFFTHILGTKWHTEPARWVTFVLSDWHFVFGASSQVAWCANLAVLNTELQLRAMCMASCQEKLAQLHSCSLLSCPGCLVPQVHLACVVNTSVGRAGGLNV